MDGYEHVNREFIQKLFKDEKRAFRETEVIRIHLPLWDEFSVPSLAGMFKDETKM